MMQRCLLVVMLANSAAAQLPIAVLDEDRTIRTRLTAIEEQLRSDSYADAISTLRQLVESDPDSLVRVSPNRLITVSDAANALLGRAGPEALAEFRTRFDPQARQWWNRSQAEKTVELRLMHQLSDELPQSNWADEALTRLGEIAWHSARPGLAYEYWSRLGTPECGGSDFDRATVDARLILCRLAMGERAAAASMFNVFRTKYPQTVGEIGGKKGQWTALLQRELNSNDWRPRTRRKPLAFDALWYRRLIPVRDDRSSDDRVPPSFKNLPVLSNQAVFASGHLFVSDCFSLHAFDLRSGLNPWSGAADSRVYSEPPAPLDGAQGIPISSPCATGDRLLVRLGSPTTSRSGNNGLLNADKSNAIVCFDVGRREGKRLWQLAASELSEQGAFESDPVAFGANCFVVLRESPPTSALRLVCLNVEDGAVRWNLRLCSGLDEPPENGAAVTAIRPAVSSTHVIVPTNNGVVCAVRHDGRFAWVSTYERRQPVKPRFASSSCISQNAAVFVAPRDADFVMAYREHTGQLIWKRRLPDQVSHLVAANSGVLTVCGKAPWGLNTLTGEVVWGGPRHAPEHFVCGRVATTDGLLLIPTRMQIEVRQASNGRAIQQPIQATGGNLAVSGGFLAVTKGQSVSIWTSD